MTARCSNEPYLLLMEASRAVQDKVRVDAARWGLNITEFYVLEVLHLKGSQTIQQIAANILVSSGSMTYVIDKLEKRGIIVRNPCPKDRRVIHIELTPEGRSLMEEIMLEHRALLENIFKVLEPQEEETLVNLLGKIKSQISDLNIEE